MVLVANHRSYTDGLTLFFALPRRVHIMARASLFKGFLGWFFKKILMFPVDREKPLAFMKYSLNTLKKNESLLIFPEGTRNLNADEAMALKSGASAIAIKAGVSVVPVILNRAPRPFRRTKIKIGSPIDTTDVIRDELTGKISETMQAMLNGFEIAPKRKKWDKIPIDTARAVVVRGAESGHEILLIKRNRLGYRDGADYFTTPGGHIDKGESARDASAREVLEETGITVNPIRLIYKRIRGDGKLVDNEMESFWWCEYTDGEIFINPESEEYQPDASDRLRRHDGTPVGTYEPVWVPLSSLANPDFDLKPDILKSQILADIEKYGMRMTRQTILLKS